MRTRGQQKQAFLDKYQGRVCREGFSKSDLRMMIDEIMSEAQKRGYEQARAECAADSRRLEWLAQHSCYYNIAPDSQGIPDWKDLSATDFRAAIDADMEGRNG